MAKQKPPKSAGKLTGFPYSDLWEEFGEPWERLHIDGLSRELIRRAFERARKSGRKDLYLTKSELQRILKPLPLSAEARARLADKLYHLAGHYYSPRFHKMDGDTPAEVKELLSRIARLAEALDDRMARVTDAVWRNVGGARWALGKRRRASPDLDWSVLRNQIGDLASSTKTIADEFPQFGRGTTEKVLLGRWLRQSAEAIELATGTSIKSKVSDSAGRNYRFEGIEGEVLERYCRRVDKGLTAKTIVQAVRAYQRHGNSGMPSKSTNSEI